MSADCKTCGVDHNPDIHRAVLSVRRWLRAEICPIFKAHAGPGEEAAVVPAHHCKHHHLVAAEPRAAEARIPARREKGAGGQMIRQSSVATYLRGLSMLALECAAEPRLLPLFIAILRLVPGTVEELQRRRLTIGT